MRFEKLLKHPDLNVIVDMLAKKEVGLRAIEKHFKNKYPDEPKYHVSETSLRKFMQEGAGVLRDKSTSIEVRNALTQYIEKTTPPEELCRKHVAVKQYQALDYAETAEAIRQELEKLDLIIGNLFIESLATTSVVLEQIKNQERDVKDFKQMTSAAKDISDMYNIYCFQKQQNSATVTENSFDDFINSLGDKENES